VGNFAGQGSDGAGHAGNEVSDAGKAVRRRLRWAGHFTQPPGERHRATFLQAKKQEAGMVPHFLLSLLKGCPGGLAYG